ncbi:MAG: 2Fe-2S iron-sulfur cluster-binding protein [Lautropia sp.]
MSAERPPEMIAPGSSDTARVDIDWKDATGHFHGQAGDRVLYAGLAAGVPLPHECATGTCGSCKATLVQGRVDPAWPQAPGAQALRAAHGEILLCQSRLAGDCRVRIGKSRPPAASITRPRFTEGRVVRSGRLTHDVVLLQMALDAPMPFLPGQFLLIAAPGVPGFRAYSMVNAPDGGDRVELIVKRKPEGALSAVLFSRSLHRLTFQVFGPLGRACLQLHAPGDALCIAGGTGIAGLMSVLEAASRDGWLREHRASVYFGVRHVQDLFFLDRLSALRERHPDHLDITIAISDEPAPATVAFKHDGLRFFQGMVHEAPQSHPPILGEQPLAYIAGPPAAVAAATRVALLNYRIPSGRILFDRFG